jgi:hypothetical protein
VTDKNKDLSNDSWLELAALSDFITQYGSGASLYDIKLSDLYCYLQNPYANIQQIQRASKYLTNRHGIIKDVLRTIKSLPTLNYHLVWSNYDDAKKIKKYEQRIYDFLDEINVKQVVRDGLYEVAEMGTVVTCLRSNKYVQFLDLDDLRINKQRNGKWVVEFDLQTINQYKNTLDKLAIIESLPDEITVERYNLYRNKGEDYRYVELSNCDVINIDAHRNFPYGLPYTLGAWAALMQKEIINRVERSMADRLIKQILILYAGTLDKEGNKPVPKDLIKAYFKEVTDLMLKKERNGSMYNNNETSGTGVITLPHFMELKALEIDTQMFKKELYEKIENEIFANLGVSSALVYGGGNSDYSSAQVNSEKLFRYIFTILEQFEYVINQYIKKFLPKDLQCHFYFERTTMLNKDAYIDKMKELYMQTGIVAPWLESLLGVPYHYAIGQAEYEKKVLKTQDIIYPAQNAYTISGDNKGGRPQTDSQNPNTIKSKSTGANDKPSPSDQ